jgi:hypothetical protein
MTSHLRRWMEVSLLSMAMAISVHGSDILLNGDFSDGKTHWHGDGDAPGGSGGGASGGGGLVITLNPDKWTAVTQRFSASTTALKLKITYSLSNDCTLGKTGDKLIPPLTSDALDEACGVSSSMNIPMSKFELWKVIVVSGGWPMTEDFVRKFRDSNPADNGSGERTYSSDINSWVGVFTDCNLCLCFPPGQGSVTLTEVKLVPPGQ